MVNQPQPDPGRVATLASHLVAKGIHESLAGQVAHDILVFHPGGGNVRVQDGVVEVMPRRIPAR